MKSSQTAQILSYLKTGASLSPLEALSKFGCLRLSGRVFELRHGQYDGIKYEIEEEPHEGKKYALYRLKPPREAPRVEHGYIQDAKYVPPKTIMTTTDPCYPYTCSCAKKKVEVTQSLFK